MKLQTFTQLLVVVQLWLLSTICWANIDDTINGAVNSVSNSKQHQPLNPELPPKLQLPPPTPFKQLPQQMTHYVIADLFEKYEKRAEKFAKVQDDNIATFDLLLDKDMVIEGIELSHLLEKALNANLPLQEFEPIGLYQKEQDNKTYTVRRSIQFKDPYVSFFRIHRQPTSDYLKNQLINRGFRQSDINLLVEFSSQTHPTQYAEKQSIEYALAQIPQLKQKFKDNKIAKEQIYQQYFNQLSYFNHYNNMRLWRQWLFNLLDNFDPQRQRILKSLIIENLQDEQSTSRQVFDRPFNHKLVSDFEQKVLSGELERQHKAAYSKYAARSDHQ